MFKHWRSDIEAVLSRDPAARSAAEVVLCYPSFRAVRRHRRAHWLWQRGHKLLARMVSQRTRKLTGIEIHPGATIGSGLFIDHGMGVVIGETAELGDNVTLYQGVTLGGTGKDVGKRHPGRVVKREGVRVGIDLDQVHLPDPVKEHIEWMTRRIEQLEKCVERKALGIACEACEDLDTENCLRTQKEDAPHEDL